VQNGTIDRRQFVRGALGLGLSVSTIAAVLQGCSGEEKASPAAPPNPDAPPAPAAEPELGPIEGELHIYMWSDYIAEDTVPNFEKEFNCKVTLDTYESNEEMIAKLQAGAGGYDLVCPSGYAITVLNQLGLMEKLVKKHIPNLGNIAPIFTSTVFDPKNEFTVPWQWGVTGIAYRKDKLPAPPDSWGLFLDAAHKGKVTMMDDMRDNIGAWLRFRGNSLNSVDPAALATAKTDALAAKANLRAYISAPVKAQLIAGDVFAAQLWNGDTMQARAENENIAFALPKEGAAIWCDSLVIPKGAKNMRAAHEFLNYILRPEVGAKISDFTGYGSPNKEAVAKMATPVAYPTDAEMALLEYQQDLGEGTAAWDQLWTEIKST
jgi:spermidine/putrescine transport system substrate-binding protein